VGDHKGKPSAIGPFHFLSCFLSLRCSHPASVQFHGIDSAPKEPQETPSKDGRHAP
jgi:hypothetical protein